MILFPTGPVFEGENECFVGPIFSTLKLILQTGSSTQTAVPICRESVLDHIGMLQKVNDGDLFLRKSII